MYAETIIDAVLMIDFAQIFEVAIIASLIGCVGIIRTYLSIPHVL